MLRCCGLNVKCSPQAHVFKHSGAVLEAYRTFGRWNFIGRDMSPEDRPWTYISWLCFLSALPFLTGHKVTRSLVFLMWCLLCHDGLAFLNSELKESFLPSLFSSGILSPREQFCTKWESSYCICSANILCILACHSPTKYSLPIHKVVTRGQSSMSHWSHISCILSAFFLWKIQVFSKVQNFIIIQGHIFIDVHIYIKWCQMGWCVIYNHLLR